MHLWSCLIVLLYLLYLNLALKNYTLPINFRKKHINITKGAKRHNYKNNSGNDLYWELFKVLPRLNTKIPRLEYVATPVVNLTTLSPRAVFKQPAQFQEYPLTVNIFFNRYTQHGKRQVIFVTMPVLGRTKFRLNITVSTKDYLIATRTTDPRKNINGWRHSSGLYALLRRHGIRDLHIPYQRCYYFQTYATFWNYKQRYAIVKVSDFQKPWKLLAKPATRSFLMRRTKGTTCVPELSLPFCADPERPVSLNPRYHNTFFAIIETCGADKYEPLFWNFYDVHESVLIGHSGETEGLVLKLLPYTIQFSYEPRTERNFLLRVDTEVNGIFAVARCYVRYEPPPVEPVIKGNDMRQVYVNDPVIMDATLSRDWAQPIQDNTRSVRWDCASETDPYNPYCRPELSYKSRIRIPANKLLIMNNYDFKLTMYSSLDPSISASTYQMVVVVDTKSFTPQIICRRNCAFGTYAPVDSVYLHALCDDCHAPIKGYEWWTVVMDDEPRLVSTQRHLLQRFNAEHVAITLTIHLADGSSAMSFKFIKRNNGPEFGNCTINPSLGIEAHTVFVIECDNFTVAYPPLEFRYTIDVGAVEANQHYSRIELTLPATEVLFVTICDAADMCVSRELSVDVIAIEPVEGVHDIKRFIEAPETNVKQKLHCGKWQEAFVISVVAAHHIENSDDAHAVFAKISPYKITTGAQLEQLLVLATHILANMSPVDFSGAAVMADIFVKVARIFEEVVVEREWLHREAFNALTAMHIFFMLILGIESEIHPKAMCKASDISCGLVQQLGAVELAKLDPLTVLKKNYWLKCSWFLYKSIYYLGVLATSRHYPYDEAFSLHRSGVAYQINVLAATQNSTATTIATIDHIHKLQISALLLRELSHALESDVILLQIISQRHFHNIYWWYPENMPVQSSILIVHAYSTVKTYPSGYLFKLKNPLVYHMNVTEYGDNEEFQKWMLNNTINDEQMHYYKLQIQPKSLLAVHIQRCTGPLSILLTLHRRPTAEQMEESGCFIPAHTHCKRIWLISFCKHATTAYVGIRSAASRDRHLVKRSSKAQKSSVTYSLLLEIFLCSSWINRTLNPGWSGDYCKTEFEHSYGKAVKCTCSILGPLSSRIYPTTATPIVVRIITPVLAINWFMVLLFLILFLLLFFLLLYNFKLVTANETDSMINCKNILQAQEQNNNRDENNDVILTINTGGQVFAGTTSNITFYFKALAQQQVSYHIYQDMSNPRLVRNSACQMLLSPHIIKLPTRLAIQIERKGRYPRWFCRSVHIADTQSSMEQFFAVDRWLENGITPFMHAPYVSSNKNVNSTLGWWQRFCLSLEHHFTNWFMWQPLLGPWLTAVSAMTRYQRSCVWICKLAVTLCIICLYIGRTSKASIQTESESTDAEKSLSVLEVLYLGVVTHLACTLVHLFFEYIIIGLIIKRTSSYN